MKFVSLLSRRPDITRRAFFDYYEGVHAPLAAKHIPWKKYVRNHVKTAVPEDPGFDCLGEFWLGRLAELGKVLAGPLGAFYSRDEENFMKMRPGGGDWASRSTAIGTDVAEHLLFGPARGVDRRGTLKDILLFKRAHPGESADFMRGIASWAGQFHSDNAPTYDRVTLDEVIESGNDTAFPADVILSGWRRNDRQGAFFQAEQPEGATVVAVLGVESQETDADELARAFELDARFTYPEHWLANRPGLPRR